MSEPLTSKLWFKWVIAVLIIGILGALATVVWKRQVVNAESLQKAQELHDKAEALGFNVPSVKTLARLFGTDGGPLCETADGHLTQALLAYNMSRTGEVNQRSAIIDKRLLEFEELVLEVYCPEKLDEFREFVDRLKLERTLPE